MPTPILATKLFIPPTRPELVPRPRLVEKINEGLDRKLTLVSAPAGFGKTTLLSELVDNVQLAAANESPVENRIAWLSLDEGDNDPVRFLSYFISALNRVDGIEDSLGEGALGMLQSHQTPPSEVVLTSLINEVTSIPDRIILFLDDYHILESSPVDDALTYLLEHLPPQMHLVISTRNDPQLPLARLRTRGQLTEIRAVDLRFTSTEATEFLNQVMGLDLSVEDIAALENRTEGWIAGLQLAAISVQSHKDKSSLIKSFSGSHRLVLDYLIEEVLSQQSESVQDFLLKTAVLNEMTGPLCNELTGHDNGQATLEMLEKANLFIIPLDEERRWYRYHHLFADLLKQRLNQFKSDLVPELHRSASKWFEQNKLSDAAIEHALASGDFDRVGSLIETRVDVIWVRGEHTKLRRWLMKLPVELFLPKPHLGIFHAWFQFSNGELDAAERTLQTVEQAIDSSTDRVIQIEPQEQISITNSDKLKLQGRASAVRAHIASYREDVPGIIQYASQALEYLPKQDLTWRSITAIVLGDAQLLKGDMNAAYKDRLDALKACQATSDIYFIMVANLRLAIPLRELGRLQQTIEICQQQMQIANKSGMSQTRIIGYLLAIWGEALAELNDLKGAIDLAKKGFTLSLTVQSGSLRILGWSFMCLMRILFSSGDLAGAEEIIQKLETIARESNPPEWVTNLMAAWQAQLWLVQEKLDAASQWAVDRGLYTDGESKLPDEIDFFLLFEYVVLARILIAHGRLDEATSLLQRLLETAEAGGRTARVIKILLLQALAYQAGDDTAQAITALEKALNLAEPEGFIRTFVDEGPPMGRLLYEALKRGISQEYISRLLEAFPVAEPDQTDPSKAQAQKSGLVEPLSDREIEVLQLISEGLTNSEIGSRLYLSPNTVKSHARNIFAKLEVNNRTQAGAKARALGLLKDT